MTRVILLLLAGALAAPASAQHAGHGKPEQAGSASDPHAGHAMPDEDADAHAGHAAPAADPHAGHRMPEASEHHGHGESAPAPPIAPPPPEAFSGPAHAADRVFGVEVMREARRDLAREHGDMRVSKLLIDQLEARTGPGRSGYLLHAQGWHGGDIHKLWVKTEIEGERGRAPEQAEVQALWSRAVDPWFDLQTGLRVDAGKGPNRTHLVLGAQGLAPYWWEVDGAVFLSTKGEVTARAEAEYDLRITQELILQPRLELDLSAQRIRELGLGTGLTSAEAGLRLRYQVSPQFAPYVGIGYERAFGGTRRLRRAEGERSGGLHASAGLRFWF